MVAVCGFSVLDMLQLEGLSTIWDSIEGWRGLFVLTSWRWWVAKGRLFVLAVSLGNGRLRFVDVGFSLVRYAWLGCMAALVVRFVQAMRASEY